MSLQLINCQFYKEKEEFFIAKKPIKLVNNILMGKKPFKQRWADKTLFPFFPKSKRHVLLYFITAEENESQHWHSEFKIC